MERAAPYADHVLTITGLDAMQASEVAPEDAAGETLEHQDFPAEQLFQAARAKSWDCDCTIELRSPIALLG